MQSKDTLYIVAYDDGEKLCLPMMRATHCEGALCSLNGNGPVLVFNTRAEARKAIYISVAYAKLRRAQGLAANEDFERPGLKNVKIIPCRLAAQQGSKPC